MPLFFATIILMKRKIHPDYIRNFIFGSEDALVSTAGVLFGIASSESYTPKQILLTGLVVIAVEALSMGAGSFLTEESVHELEGTRNHQDNTVIDGLIMFLSYLITGLIVLLPYVFLTGLVAKLVSIILAVAILFTLGVLPKKSFKDGIRMVLVAGGAIGIGFLVAHLVDTL